MIMMIMMMMMIPLKQVVLLGDALHPDCHKVFSLYQLYLYKRFFLQKKTNILFVILYFLENHFIFKIKSFLKVTGLQDTVWW